MTLVELFNGCSHASTSSFSALVKLKDHEGLLVALYEPTGTVFGGTTLGATIPNLLLTFVFMSVMLTAEAIAVRILESAMGWNFLNFPAASVTLVLKLSHTV